jgi:hypothetical protein
MFFLVLGGFPMLKSITVVLALFLSLAACLPASGQDTRHISLRSTYLASSVEGYRQFTLVGDLEGEMGRAVLVLDPNVCSLNQFGDHEICTRIAPTSRTVSLSRTRTADPLGINRQLWAVTGSSLTGTLFLVVPDTETGPYRFVHEERAGQRTVIALEPLVYYAEAEKKTQRVASAAEIASKCKELARNVDGLEASAQVRPGFIKETYFLFLAGKKPHANTWVEIKPVVYVKQPEYWRIDVMECHSGDILLPTVMPYLFDQEITSTMGTKGIELHWAGGEVQKIDKDEKVSK